MLKLLQSHPCAGPFMYPVDPQLQGCPDYFQIITQPMDLQTIQAKIRQNKYASEKKFFQDIRQIWSNSYIYNPKSSQLYQMTLQMDQFFEQKRQELFDKQTSNNHIANLHKQVNQLQREISSISQKANLKGGNANQLNYQPQRQLKMNTPMTPNEKKILRQNIMRLPPDSYNGVWEILKQECSTNNQQLSFDIDALSARKQRELEQYVNLKLSKHQKKLVKQQEKNLKKKQGSDEENSITLQNQPLNQQDLTHSFNPSIPHWKGFDPEVVETPYTVKKDGFWVQRYNFPGQWGTHVDAPGHFVEGQITADQIDVKKMILPLVIIDIHAKAQKNNDYQVQVQDILDWERKYARIPDDSFVALRTDWHKKWPNQDLMLNKDENEVLHYPGWSQEVLEFLCSKRKITAIGHETTDTDPGFMVTKDNYDLELYILQQGKFQIELLNNLDQVPEFGSLVSVTFPKPSNSPGFPARVFAIFDD